MGHVYVDAELIGGKGVGRFRTLVDTGTTYTMVPRRIAEELGITSTGKRVKVLTAKGEAVLEEGIAVIRLMGEERTNVVLISDEIEQLLIGVTTLESFGLRVDLTTGRLERVGVLLLTCINRFITLHG
ncbi:MAG: aspartyl protease family protein [Vulcanisaeta sp.]